jgi:hypothetical protein
MRDGSRRSGSFLLPLPSPGLRLPSSSLIALYATNMINKYLQSDLVCSLGEDYLPTKYLVCICVYIYTIIFFAKLCLLSVSHIASNNPGTLLARAPLPPPHTPMPPHTVCTAASVTTSLLCCHLLSVAAISSPLHPSNPTESEFQTAPIRRKRRSHEGRMVRKTFRYKVWARSCALPERTPYVLSKRNETVRSSSIRAMYLTMFSSLLYAYTPTGCLPPSAPSRAQTRRRPR